MNEGVIGIDIGGTNLRVGLLNEKLQLIRKEKTLIKEFKNADEMFHSINKMIKKVDRFGIANTIGIALPVPWMDHTDMILDATNIPFLEKMSIRKINAYFPDYKVYFENDVNVIALLESRYGASKGCQHSMYITISTGIGSGIILNNAIFHGSHGYAGEIGSMIISECKRSHPVLYDGSLESLSGGIVLEEISKRLYGEAATTSLLFKKYQLKDQKAVEVIDLWIDYFSSAIASLMQIIDPEVFVLGGAIIHHNQWLIEKMMECTRKKLLYNLRGKLKMVISKFGPDAGIIGAGLIAMENLKKD